MQTIIALLFSIVKPAVDTKYFLPALYFVNYFCHSSAQFMGGDLSVWSWFSAMWWCPHGCAAFCEEEGGAWFPHAIM